MTRVTSIDPIALLALVIHEAGYEPSFTCFEIGARPTIQEPFYRLIDLFPGSHIIAFEPDEQVCRTQNALRTPSVRFYPIALAKSEGSRSFYVTENPACSSLYPPNEALLSRYNNLEMARLKKVTTVSTVSLDGFTENNDIGDVDFIKIDIQGAELEVFQGGEKTLRNVLAIVSEVEFIELYVGQPLFGDLCAFLSTQGMQIQKFLGARGRTLKPIVLDDNPAAVGQHMWSDALFIRKLFEDDRLNPMQYLKLAVLGMLYNCVDVALFCLREVDVETGSGMGEEYLRRLKQQ